MVVPSRGLELRVLSQHVETQRLSRSDVRSQMTSGWQESHNDNLYKIKVTQRLRKFKRTKAMNLMSGRIMMYESSKYM